jgi:hypothetical protein
LAQSSDKIQEALLRMRQEAVLANEWGTVNLAQAALDQLVTLNKIILVANKMEDRRVEEHLENARQHRHGVTDHSLSVDQIRAIISLLEQSHSLDLALDMELHFQSELNPTVAPPEPTIESSLRDDGLISFHIICMCGQVGDLAYSRNFMPVTVNCSKCRVPHVLYLLPH